MTRPDKIVVTERQFQAQVRELAALLGWDAYCSWTSIHSPGGWPDLVLVHPGKGRVIFAELKSDKGRVSVRQQYCLDSLELCGQEIYVWRPGDLEEIARVLRQERITSEWAGHAVMDKP